MSVPTIDDLRVKLCYICREEEQVPSSPSSQADPENSQPKPQVWTHPCKCTLVAHESCLLSWIQTAESSRDGLLTSSSSQNALRCPQCKTPYELESDLDRYLWGRALKAFVELMRKGNKLMTTTGSAVLLAVVPAATLGGVGLGTGVLLTRYGVWAVKQFFGEQLYNTVLPPNTPWPWTAYINLPLIPIALVLTQFLPQSSSSSSHSLISPLNTSNNFLYPLISLLLEWPNFQHPRFLFQSLSSHNDADHLHHPDQSSISLNSSTSSSSSSSPFSFLTHGPRTPSLWPPSPFTVGFILIPLTRYVYLRLRRRVLRWVLGPDPTRFLLGYYYENMRERGRGGGRGGGGRRRRGDGGGDGNGNGDGRRNRNRDEQRAGDGNADVVADAERERRREMLMARLGERQRERLREMFREREEERDGEVEGDEERDGQRGQGQRQQRIGQAQGEVQMQVQGDNGAEVVNLAFRIVLGAGVGEEEEEEEDEDEEEEDEGEGEGQREGEELERRQEDVGLAEAEARAGEEEQAREQEGPEPELENVEQNEQAADAPVIDDEDRNGNENEIVGEAAPVPVLAPAAPAPAVAVPPANPVQPNPAPNANLADEANEGISLTLHAATIGRRVGGALLVPLIARMMGDALLWATRPGAIGSLSRDKTGGLGRMVDGIEGIKSVLRRFLGVHDIPERRNGTWTTTSPLWSSWKRGSTTNVGLGTGGGGIGNERNITWRLVLEALWGGGRAWSEHTNTDPVWWRNVVGFGIWVLLKDALSLFNLYLLRKEFENRRVKNRSFEEVQFEEGELIN
ncbi:hypothetical protein K435DRAFT_774870 [Dendrothele bispora CBS 962.96]|uniref:RING-CH-type domain-containing protein n=1 Tax=Dendrothele bispora (strain CBS 962.96) TaxID=1314807 RepID=A0A4S8MKX7_DENBC|nr:hypothetical protein K435DRAFT_774870 [Dendrothele bispora CBS 962.96]